MVVPVLEMENADGLFQPVIEPMGFPPGMARTIAVDLPLKGDPEISRVHATLMFDDQGKYWITAKGRNPTRVSSSLLATTL